MKKWLSVVLSCLLAFTPVLAGATSWLDSLLGGSYDYGAENSYGSDLSGLMDIFGGLLTEDDSAWGYEEDDWSSSGSDLGSLFGSLMGGYDSSDSYGGYSSDSYGDLGSLFGSLMGGYDSSDSYGSYDDYTSTGSSLDALLGGLMGGSYGSSYGSGGDMFGSMGSSALNSLFGYGLDSSYSWYGGTTGDVISWTNPDIPMPKSTGDDTTWAIYWYLCGSDLETNGGLATKDLNEMLSTKLPDNVTVVIETGGARQWKNSTMKNDRLQRWLYQGGEFKLIDEQPSASMGRMETLASFLDFCNRNFPADKRAVVFWNHGGGSVKGAAFDERYNHDALTLGEMKQAFENVFDRNEKKPPFEMIGFDTCLMATIDVAHIFSGMGRYLVASEETEPGTGWDYSAMLSAIAKNPGISGAKLGQVICDSYGEACKASRTHSNITLSVTDLTRLKPLVEAYERFGAEALRAAASDKGFFARFARAAARSENYGGNTREQGYTNMVDLGHLARLTADMLPSAQDVIEGLDNCILYRINGSYRSEATGLSAYYTYSGNVNDLQQYAQNGVGDAFAQYYYYGLTGRITEEGEAILQQGQTQPVEPVTFETLADTDWDGIALSVDENGDACLNLGPQADELLSGIGFQLFWIDDEEGLMMFLGTDNDMEGSWEDGVFYDNFRGVWGSLNDQLVYMELSFEGEDYNLYSVPILLNNEECHLQVAYDFVSEEWQILGARQGLESSGMAYKDMRLLRNGDVICPVWYATSLDDDSDDFEAYAMDDIVITDSLTFGETTLPDGVYGLMFEMWDAQNNYVYSQPVYFEMDGGDIYTLLDE